MRDRKVPCISLTGQQGLGSKTWAYMVWVKDPSKWGRLPTGVVPIQLQVTASTSEEESKVIRSSSFSGEARHLGFLMLLEIFKTIWKKPNTSANWQKRLLGDDTWRQSPFITVLRQTDPFVPLIHQDFPTSTLAYTYPIIFCLHSYPLDLNSNVPPSNLSLTVLANVSPPHKSLPHQPVWFFL